MVVQIFLARRFCLHTTIIKPCSRLLVRQLTVETTAQQHSRVPPLLTQIRSDLKGALKERNRNRLSVIRGILAQVDELSKVNRPVAKDAQLYQILKARLNLSKSAAVDFADAKRDDLMEKENAQIAVLEEYLDALDPATDDDILRISSEIIAELRSSRIEPRMGQVIGRLLKALDGRPVEMDHVSRIVRGIISPLEE